ncbi:MAG: 50S ribosomal protein L13 [Planctomycetota bacterium]|jgi:large subunit ribosomal protein L13|nr:50S ribosomal protein L13 [Planctomycetota bacterium]
MERQTTLATAKQAEESAEWWQVDATNMVVGRLAAELARRLMGKHKPIYTPYVDCGDFIVVTNCGGAVLTGNKMRDKVFRYHTGYLGGLKEVPMKRMLAEHPDRIIRNAVRRMLPKTKMGRQMLKKLKIYASAEHPHTAQQPKELIIPAGRN